MRAWVALLAAWAALALAATASAHATLESSTPERGAELKSVPAEVALRFNEQIEAGIGSMSVFDSAGERVDDGSPFRPAGRADEIGVRLQSDLGDGSYTVTYRVVSADSHPVEGGYVFSVGPASEAPAASVDSLLGDGAGPWTERSLAAARGVGYAAIALVVGALVFAFAVGPHALATLHRDEYAAARAAGVTRLRALAGWAALAGFVASLAGILLQGAFAGGISVADALDGDVIREVLGTRFGEVWAIRALAFGLIAFACLRPSRAMALPLGAVCAFLVMSPALSGHASARSPSLVLIPSVAGHVAAMSVWVGGIAALLFALPAATRTLRPGRRSVLLAAALDRFSPIALWSVALLVTTGTLQSILELEAIGDLAETGFGRAILAKIVIVSGLVAIGVIHRRRSLPGIRQAGAEDAPPGAAGRRIRSLLLLEGALMAGALAATAALATSTPPDALAAGPYAESRTQQELRAELTVDPASPGPNEAHVYLTDAETGAPFEPVKELTATAAETDAGIGPLELDARPTGPGHFTIPRADLATEGDWTVTLEVRVSAFDVYELAYEVPVE